MKNIKIDYCNNSITEMEENVVFRLVDDDVLYRTGKTIVGSYENITGVLTKHYPANNNKDFTTVFNIALSAVLVSVNMNVKHQIKNA